MRIHSLGVRSASSAALKMRSRRAGPQRKAMTAVKPLPHSRIVGEAAVFWSAMFTFWCGAVGVSRVFDKMGEMGEDFE